MTDYYKCSRCDRVAFGVTKAFAEAESAAFNAWYAAASPDIQAHYSRPSLVEHYARCVQCGASNLVFELTKTVPPGVTLSPIIAPPDMDQYFTETYPTLFPTITNMHGTFPFPFECGRGWYGLLDRLAAALAAYPDVRATQVKEKFGTLRFYYTGGNATTDVLVDAAAAESAKTCETCGDPGTLRNNGWLTVKCAACHAHYVEEDATC